MISQLSQDSFYKPLYHFKPHHFHGEKARYSVPIFMQNYFFYLNLTCIQQEKLDGDVFDRLINYTKLK